MERSNRRTEDAYGRWSRTYDDSRPPHTRLDEQPGLALLDARPGEKILDVACGTGKFARLLESTGALVTGCDLSEAMLEVAREACPSARFIRADLEGALPFAAGEFDKIVCSMALKHVRNLAGAIAEFRRIVTSGGRLVFSASHEASDTANYAIAHPALVSVDRDTEIFNYGRADFAAALCANGWEIEASESLAVGECVRHIFTPESYRALHGTPLVLLVSATAIG